MHCLNVLRPPILGKRGGVCRSESRNRVYPLHLASLTDLECRWLSTGLARLQVRWCEIGFSEGSKPEHRSVSRESHTGMSEFQFVQNCPKLIPQSLGHVRT